MSTRLRQGRALTVAVALVLALLGLGFAVLALRPQAVNRASDAQSSRTEAVGDQRANGLIAFGCGYHICTMSQTEPTSPT
jgi:hypothetical protein